MLSQRELKFRVYQFSTHRMFYAGEYRLKFNRDHIFHPLLENNFQPKKKDYIVLEWTGLIDKNGRDIYEGDIVRIENGLLCPVYWFSPTAGFAPFGGGIGELKASRLEVVGNIYENHELLEVGS